MWEMTLNKISTRKVIFTREVNLMFEELPFLSLRMIKTEEKSGAQISTELRG